MITQRRFSLFLGVVLIVLLLFIVVACGASQESKSSPIVHESIASTATLPELDTIPTTPHAVLTSAQVISYVGTSEFMGGATLSGKPPTILVCKQMTVGEAESKLGSEIADDKSAPVFLVELQGPFTIPHAVPPHHRKFAASPTSTGYSPPVVNKVYEVFDAQSGNVLIWGVIDDGQAVPAAAQTAIVHEGLVP